MAVSKMKLFTVSFDDGLEQDKKLISLMKKYGIKGTFNLNSGLFGNHTEIIRVKDLGFMEITDTAKFPAKLFPHVHHHRIPEDEIRQVYEGFEIACHGKNHRDMSGLKKDEIAYEIGKDRSILEELLGYSIKGFALPFGRWNEETKRYLQKNDFAYCRNVKSSNRFELILEDGILTPTCWHAAKNAEILLDNFLKKEDDGKKEVFFMWGHGYEFDYGTGNCSWRRIESMFDKVQKSGCRCVNNIEAVQILPDEN